MPVWFKVFVCILVALVATMAMGIGLWVLLDSIRFSRQAIRAIGTVVRIHSQWEERTRYDESGSHREQVKMHYPVIAFEDLRGMRHEVQATFGNACTPAYRIGESVPILFPPDDPQRMRINSFLSLYGIVPFMFFLAAVSTVILVFFSLYW